MLAEDEGRLESLPSCRIENLQEQIYGQEKKNREYYKQHVRWELKVEGRVWKEQEKKGGGSGRQENSHPSDGEVQAEELAYSCVRLSKRITTVNKLRIH